MHFTKLADARRSKACSAWHTGQDCLNDCFHFAVEGLLEAFKWFYFYRQKDLKKEHYFVQNFKMSGSKGSKKKKVCFRHTSCILKVHSNLS